MFCDYSSATTNGTRANVVNDAKTGQPIALSTPSNVLGQYAYDGSGNPFGLLTNSPAAFAKGYDPYGTNTVTYNGGGDGLPANPFGFKAGIEDTHTGLVKFGLRWYNPYLGAWTQQDTLDSPLDPANGNRYAYAASDPINGSDPSGLSGSVAGCSPFQQLSTVGVYGGVAGGLAAAIPIPGSSGLGFFLGASVGLGNLARECGGAGPGPITKVS